MALITNFWGDITLVCGNHKVDSIEDYPEMVIKSGPYSMYYACPKEEYHKCVDGEVPCYNRINLIDYEKMLNHIMDLMVDAEDKNEKPHLANHKWKEKSREYEVLSHVGDKLVIKMVDSIAIKGHKV